MVITEGVRVRARRPVRLWIPIVPVLVVLSPLLVPALLIGMAVMRVNPMTGALAVLRVVWAARGLQVHVQDRDVAIRVTIR